MKIAIVTQFFFPDNFLINDISAKLVKNGNEVTVLTGLPDYSTNKIPEEYTWFKRRHEFIKGVEVIRVPIIARRQGIIFRALNYLSFMIMSGFYVFFKPLKADLILSYQTAPVLMTLAAIILKRKLRVPLLIYCLDVWPDQLKVWKVKENNIIFKLVHRYSKFAYSAADILAISSEPFRSYMIEVNKVDGAKIELLPQHSASMLLDDSSDINSTKKDSKNINLVFAGSIGKQQNLECLINAIAFVPADLDFIVHIFGDGVCLETCKELAAKLDILKHIVFYGRVPQNSLKTIYNQADAFILTMRSVKEIGFSANTVPTRLNGYMSAGKPIIASIDGGAQEIIKENKLGICVPASSPKELAEAITDFITNQHKYKQCGNNSLKYYNDNCTEEVFLKRLTDIFNRLLSKTNNGGK